jgi:hypothetical protein
MSAYDFGMSYPVSSLGDGPDPAFVPALAFCKHDILDDPRVRKQSGVPVYEVDVAGETYRVTEVPAGMYGDGRPGWAVFDPDGHWRGGRHLSDSEPFHAQAIYLTAIQAMNMVLLPYKGGR